MRAAHTEEPVTVCPVSDGYKVTLYGETTTLSPCDESDVEDTERHAQLRALFRDAGSIAQPVAEAEVGPLLDDGDRAAFDMRIGSASVRFVFDEPSASDSLFWDVVDAVGVGDDPLAMEGTTLAVSHLLVQPFDAFTSNRKMYKIERGEALVVNDDGWVLHEPSAQDEGWFPLF